jgi:hypothetical protein
MTAAAAQLGSPGMLSGLITKLLLLPVDPISFFARGRISSLAWRSWLGSSMIHLLDYHCEKDLEHRYLVKDS